jgi:O-6-methylguanine DNA methyltransferase
MNDLDHGAGMAKALAGLAVDPPPRFSERIFAGWTRIEGPLGPIFVAFTAEGIDYVRPADLVGDDPVRFRDEYRDRFVRPIRQAERPPAGLATAVRTGRARHLRFDLRRLTEFEQAVLRKALEIPRGETRPYAWIAREIGRPGAVRAIGSALGRNPVPILIPCHRVVRSDGDPGNYAFGPERKQALLTAEDVNLDDVRQLASEGIHFTGSDTTHIVCYPTCHDARRTTERHRVGFPSLAKAIDAGYRPCRHCRPASVAGAA